MAARRIPKEVQAIFDKYIKNNVRKLKKDDAIKMMETEFSLSTEQAAAMFDTFDKDKNGIMSLWEFQQSYQCVGNSAAAMVEKFKELDKDNSGKLDVDEARAGLMSMQTVGGRALEEREIDFFMKASLGEDNQVDLGAFANLLFRLKMYKPRK